MLNAARHEAAKQQSQNKKLFSDIAMGDVRVGPIRGLHRLSTHTLSGTSAEEFVHPPLPRFPCSAADRHTGGSGARMQCQTYDHPSDPPVPVPLPAPRCTFHPPPLPGCCRCAVGTHWAPSCPTPADCGWTDKPPPGPASAADDVMT